MTPQSQLSPKACPPPPGAGARPLGLLRVRGLPSPPTHSQLGGRPPEPFHRPRGRAWGVSRGPRWSKFIITAHCTASVGGSHWTRSGTAAVPNSRGLLPAPHSAPTPRRRRPLPSGDRCLWTPLPFQSRRWARQAFGERRAPRPRGKQRCCYGPRLRPAESTPAAPRAQAPGGEPGAAPVRHRAARGWVGAGRGGAGGGCQGDGGAEPVSPAIRLAVEGPRWGDAALWGWTGELAARPRPATRPAGGTAACFSGAGGRMPPAVASFTTILYFREVTYCWSQPHLLPHKPRKAIGR